MRLRLVSGVSVYPADDDLVTLLCVAQVVEALLPFDRTGPFVSMVKDSFKAVVPFMALGASVLFGFSFAIRVIFVYTDQKENQKNDCEAGSGTPPAAYANSSVVSMLNDHKDQCKNNDTDLDFPHTVKILFQASVRNFEEEVRRSFALFHGLMECLSVVGEQKFRSMKETCFIGIWRSVLFTIFLFVGAIICLNLLIAILSDSFDKIKHWEEEELVMCRAEIVSAAFVSVAHDIIEKESSRQVPVTSLLSVTVLSQRDDLEQAEKLASLLCTESKSFHTQFDLPEAKTSVQVLSLLGSNRRDTEEKEQSMGWKD